MAKTNKEILNAIRNEASAEYKERVPEVTTASDYEAVLAAYDQYPSIKNEFINTINAKIFKSVVMNKVWNNPLQMLKKGEIPYGQGIEQLFAEIADKKNWDEHWGTGSDENDLIGKTNKSVAQRFIQKNFAYKYKVSLSNQRLRSAFSSENGVANLIDGLVASVMTAANNEEFQDMLKILVRDQKVTGRDGAAKGGLGDIEKGIIDRIAEKTGLSGGGQKTPMLVEVPKLDHDGYTEKELTAAIRTYASELTFLSDKYNLAGVKTACNPEDLVLFTTSDVVAKLDVHVIASAFNVSAAEVNVRVIKVPMGTFKPITGNWGHNSERTAITPIAILADKEAIQQYDTLIESGSFYNPATLMTNLFVHRQGITASCDFAQTVVFGHK